MSGAVEPPRSRSLFSRIVHERLLYVAPNWRGVRLGDVNLFKGLKPILYGGREVWPLIEGGKGVSATNHASSGAWAAAGGIGTV